MWKFKKILKMMTGVFCALCLAAVSVEAGQASVSVSLSAQQWVEKNGKQEMDDTFEYILKASDTGNPMPGGAQTDRLSFSMTGNQRVQLEEILYTRPGIYHYEVSQSIPAGQKGYEYDDRRYSIEVTVKSTFDQGLEAVVIILNEKGEKCDGLEFTNKYRDSALSSGRPSLQSGAERQGKPVKTGDTMEAGLWVCLIAGSGGILLCSAIFKRKKS